MMLVGFSHTNKITEFRSTLLAKRNLFLINNVQHVQPDLSQGLQMNIHITKIFTTREQRDPLNIIVIIKVYVEGEKFNQTFGC